MVRVKQKSDLRRGKTRRRETIKYAKGQNLVNVEDVIQTQAYVATKFMENGQWKGLQENGEDLEN